MTPGSFDPLRMLDTRRIFNAHQWLTLWRWCIALVEIVFGSIALYGLGAGLWIEPNRWVLALIWVFYGITVAGGLLLAANRSWGVRLSLIAQAIQLLQMSAGRFFYQAVCGPWVMVGLYFNGDRFRLAGGWDLSADFQILWNAPSAAVLPPGSEGGSVPSAAITGVNLVAAAAIYCLLLVQADNRDRKAIEASRNAGTPD